MKPKLTTYFVIVAILVAIACPAQEMDSTQTTDTILLIESPYKKGRTKWLNKNGFDTRTYDWNDQEINLYIDQAVKNRSTGNVFAYTGGGILLVGVLANGLGQILHGLSDKENKGEYDSFKGPYILGGVMVATSIVLHVNSFASLKKAKSAREKKFK